ncbi:unnamed protein product [Discula destructiva]
MPATFDVELHFPLPATLAPDVVIRNLHAYEPLIRPNPYLQSFSRLPVNLDEVVSDPFFTEDGTNIVKYEIHDRIPVIPAVGWTSPVVFPAIFQSIPAGVRLRANAAAGTVVRSVYGVERVSGGGSGSGSGSGGDGEAEGWALVERSHVECHALLRPFVQKQFEAGHRDLGRRVLENIVAATQKTLPPLPQGNEEEER